MMNNYLPKNMLEQEYRYESVNYQLYNHLNKINPYSNLKKILSDLVKKQEIQLFILKQTALFFGIRLHMTSLKTDKDQNFQATVKELYDREFQLLQEYLSYLIYFLPKQLQKETSLIELFDIQQSQVNTLNELMRTVSKQESEKEQTYILEKDYLLEKGYRLEKLAANLTFPIDITFDEEGYIYILEAGFAYGAKPGEGRILKLERDGTLSEVADGFLGPATGITYYNGYFYLAEGGRGNTKGIGCGRILKVSKDGNKVAIVSGLRSCGDHFTGDVRFGPDGKLYFTVGTATNTAVVGTDNTPWLKIHPGFHDLPARDLELRGKNFISHNPLSGEPDLAVTGAYKRFNVSSYNGEKIQGELMANGVIYSCNPDGSDLKVVADGFRNPFGLRFSPFNGKMYVTDNNTDDRGSRPVYHDWDNFWEVTPNGWHGWPDFFSGLPATLPHFHVDGKNKPTFVLNKHPGLTSQPVTRFKPSSSSDKFDFSTNHDFGHVGEAFVAQLGNMGREAQSGFKVVRVNLETGQIRDFLVNPLGEDMKNGPIRPVAATFSPDGKILCVVDFGLLAGKDRHNTGALWRIVKA